MMKSCNSTKYNEICLSYCVDTAVDKPQTTPMVVYRTDARKIFHEKLGKGHFT